MEEEIKHKCRFKGLSDEEIDEIAFAAAMKAQQLIKDEFFIMVGKSIVRRVVWFTIAATLALMLWLQSKRII